MQVNDYIHAIESDKALQPENRQEDFLQIMIGGEPVLITSAEVREVVRPLPLTAVPMGPNHLLGLANIRGQIVCIIDLGKISALPSVNRNVTPRSRFIVLRHARMNLGLWADEVRSTQQISQREITVTADSEQAPGPVFKIEYQGQPQYMLNCTKLFH